MSVRTWLGELQGRLPPWIRLPPSAALPFGAFEAALAHEGNADVSADFVRAAGFGAGPGELDADARRAVRAAVLRLRAPPALRSDLLSALAAEGDELGCIGVLQAVLPKHAMPCKAGTLQWHASARNRPCQEAVGHRLVPSSGAAQGLLAL